MNSRLPDILGVLKRDRDAALARLLQPMRISSISTDPTCRQDCRRAVGYCCDPPREPGFDAHRRQPKSIRSPDKPRQRRKAGVFEHSIKWQEVQAQGRDA